MAGFTTGDAGRGWFGATPGMTVDPPALRAGAVCAEASFGRGFAIAVAGGLATGKRAAEVDTTADEGGATDAFWVA